MKLTGTQVIPASRERVWMGLNDPVILQQCIPGCSKIEVVSPTEFTATVTVAVGPVKANFAGQVTLSDLNPPESYRISGKGNGGFVGFATGGANIRLTALSANETQMDYDVDAQIGGKLAMLGSRLIDSTATSMADKFFTKFGSLIKSQAGAQHAASSAATKTKAPAKKTSAKKPAAKKSLKSAKKPVAKKAGKKVAGKKLAKPVKKVVAKKAAKVAKKAPAKKAVKIIKKSAKKKVKK
jgi:uncharacterized protein